MTGPQSISPDSEIVRLINVLRADEGDSVEILCDNPDFNGQPNCAIVCCGDWTGWLHKRFAADTLLDALSMAMVEKNLPSPRKVIATSNGHHWIERFNLVCCRDCGFVRRTDDQNKPCQGVVGVGIRRDLLPPHLPDEAAGVQDPAAWQEPNSPERIADQIIGKIWSKKYTDFRTAEKISIAEYEIIKAIKKERSRSVAQPSWQPIIERLCKPESGHTIHDVVANYRAIRRDALAISSTPRHRPFCSCKASQRDGQHMAWCPAVTSTEGK